MQHSSKMNDKSDNCMKKYPLLLYCASIAECIKANCLAHIRFIVRGNSLYISHFIFLYNERQLVQCDVAVAHVVKIK